MALREELVSEQELLTQIDPEVLAIHLPQELVGRLLALEHGELTATGVMVAVTPEILAAHVPHDLLWACIRMGAQRAGLCKVTS
jgi:hypothetical protein